MDVDWGMLTAVSMLLSPREHRSHSETSIGSAVLRR